MSKFEIKMPKLGESITEGTIISWSVKVGDTIEEDDVLFEVETVKVTAEIPSPVAGTLLEILFKEGETAAVGEVVAIIDTEGGEVSTTASAATADEKVEQKVEETKAEAPQPSAETKPSAKNSDPDQWFSPVVLSLIKQHKLNVEELNFKGTGYLGRLTKRDILNYINKGEVAPTASTPAPAPAPAKKAEDKVAAPQSPALVPADNDTVVEMSTIRRVTAERMVASRKTSAHVTTVVEADVTKLVNWRNSNKKQFADHEGIGLTFMPAIVSAVAQSLIKYPQINASVDNTRIILKKDINIGIAVALEGWNLIVPVIHKANQLNIAGLAHSIDELATKARNNKLKMTDIEGGTFTITNFGSFKNILGTPIINQPEVAILGVGMIEKKPAVISTPEGDVIAIRHKMYLSLSYDHRVIDGALGGAFVLDVATRLENWNTPL